MVAAMNDNNNNMMDGNSAFQQSPHFFPQSAPMIKREARQSSNG